MDPHCHYNIESLMSANFITVAFFKIFKEPSLTTYSSYHILLTCQTSFSEKMVGMEGLAPPRFYPRLFESRMSSIPSHPR